MFFPRPHGRAANLLRLSATAFFLVLFARAAIAQNPDVEPPTVTPPATQPQVPNAIPTQNAVGQAVPAAVQVPASTRPALPPYAPQGLGPRYDALGSAYIPVDSVVYPMALRLYSMGYLNTAFINMRPWTRRSLLHMLELSSPAIIASGDDQAIDLLERLDHYISSEGAEDATTDVHFDRGNVYGVQSVYTRIMGISGQTLRDSYHLGQTISQDYGRPYEPGVNNITGFATLNEWWRFSLYVRGEYQHAPSSYGYSLNNTGSCNRLVPVGLAEQLSAIDEIDYCNPYNANQATIPSGPIAAQNPFRLQEATLSFHVLGHEISGGKSDNWGGPGLGSAMNWSNNAEDIYSFRINRVEPLHVPLVSRVLGPLRYDFFVGSLKGHTAPNEPWVHSEMFSFAPTSDFQFAFSRTVIWGGHGHGCLPVLPDGEPTPCDEPINLHTFFKSLFSISDTNGALKNSPNDPGARYSDFSFSYRLPFDHRRILLYTDSISHDDVSPISAPRRASYRPGIYISELPYLPKFDFRVEGANTDCSTKACAGGTLEYWEAIQKQGYTNKGFIMGDWIGREALGGQAWLTYHLSGNEWVQVEYLKKRTHSDFIPGGVTQNQYKVDVVKRLAKDVELDAWVQLERWKAPIYIQKANNAANFDNAVTVQVTWFPKLHNDVKGIKPVSER